MQDIQTMLSALRRPSLLIRAARFGAQDYRRDRHLQRVLGYGGVPRSAQALVSLMDIERMLNDQRVSDDAGYSLPRHVDVMIPILGEARLLQHARTVTASTP